MFSCLYFMQYSSEEISLMNYVVVLYTICLGIYRLAGVLLFSDTLSMITVVVASPTIFKSISHEALGLSQEGNWPVNEYWII